MDKVRIYDTINTVLEEEPTLQQLLEDLRFISHIKEHDKVDIHAKKIVSGILESAWRAYANDQDREDTYFFIKKVTDKAVERLESPSEGSSIRKFLVEAMGGIERLKTTYYRDKFYTSKLDVILYMLKEKLK